jgi:hypothetical protein
MTAIVICAFVIAITSCSFVQVINESKAPAAKTPSGLSIKAVFYRGGPWIEVGPNSRNEYEILPSELGYGEIQVSFYAPYPSVLMVSIDGTDLMNFDDIRAGVNPSGLGCYRIDKIDETTRSPRGVYWKITLIPPPDKRRSDRFTIYIRDRSINPKYTDPGYAGREKESEPLVIKAVARGPEL